MKFTNKTAKSADNTGTWIVVIGIFIFAISALCMIAVFSGDTPMAIYFGISGMVTGLFILGFGKGLKCLADICESNYRNCKVNEE